MTRKPPFGSAQKELLLKVTAPSRGSLEWSTSDPALYDGNRELTVRVFNGLVLRGLADETVEEHRIVYRVNNDGIRTADKLRGRRPR